MNKLMGKNIDLNKIDYIKSVVIDRDKYSFNKDKKRKSALEVYDHFVRWYLKYDEIDRLYFLTGNDVEGRMVKYYSTRLCLSLRDKYNSQDGTKNYRVLLDDKYLFNELCNLWGIDTVKVYALSHEGKIQWISEPKVGDPIFIKERYGGSGSAISSGHYINKLKVLNHEGEEIDINNLIKNGNDIIVEQTINQIREISEFNSSSINTIKLTTTIQDDVVKVRFGFIRFGTKKSKFMDNWGAGAVLVDFNIDRGTLKSKGSYKYSYFDPNGRGTTTLHPESKMHFKGFEIPFYKESIDLVTRAHRKLHHIYSIGWDIAITEDGPLIIEGNYNWDVTAPQYLKGYTIMNEMFCNEPSLTNFFEYERG